MIVNDQQFTMAGRVVRGVTVRAHMLRIVISCGGRRHMRPRRMSISRTQTARLAIGFLTLEARRAKRLNKISDPDVLGLSTVDQADLTKNFVIVH